MLYAEMEDGYRSDELLNFPFGPRSLASGIMIAAISAIATAIGSDSYQIAADSTLVALIAHIYQL